MAQKTLIDLKDNKEHHLRYDLNCLCDIETVFDCGFFNILKNWDGFRLTRCLLWAGLKWKDKKMTQVKAGKIIEEYIDAGGKMKDISAICMDALTASGALKNLMEPDEDDDDSDEEPDTDEVKDDQGNA